MIFGLFDGEDDREPSGIGFVWIFKIFETWDDFIFDTVAFDRL